jgi:WD40 repeat protein
VNDGTKRFEAENSGGVVAMNRDYVVSQPNWETPRVFDARTGRKLADLAGHKEQVAQIVFLPDRRTIVTAAWDGTIRFWEMPGGRPVAVSRSQRQGLYALTLSPDGRTLAAGGQDGVVRFWNVTTRQETIRMIERQPISQLWFTPDGHTLVEQTADSIRLTRGPEASEDSPTPPNF